MWSLTLDIIYKLIFDIYLLRKLFVDKIWVLRISHSERLIFSSLFIYVFSFIIQSSLTVYSVSLFGV